ncbi:cobalt ECF transporter T component CbiQ [Methanotorris formicicus]|uniref:Cobalt ABC transporter, inner membrane subunit CbiQ n=1 Tax=Methanotorris formicicus Mc-S-70 TaxID=647171 RepID=H1KYB8_9EURY|nr:cobalt ECF transporter T component CbiQ [Methanotorris formicicus]EHP87383.1 cobalt ABC transporter, inner membrane subunit CbiQ [Methanotorris formicicus Mc-S-70]
MKYNTVDNIAFNNKLKHVNPKLKVIFALSLLLISVFSKSAIVPLLIFFVVSILLLFKAKIPKKIYVVFVGIPFGFGLLNLLIFAFLFGTVEWFKINIFGFEIPIYKDGIDLGVLLFGRMLGGISSMLFLAFTTPMVELFYIFRELKMPDVVVDMMMLIYRYIFVLYEEYERMKFAQESRLGTSNLKSTYKSLGALAAHLFIRAWEKGEILNITMMARCYDGKLRLLHSIENPPIKYILFIAIFDILLIILVYLTRNFAITSYIKI